MDDERETRELEERLREMRRGLRAGIGTGGSAATVFSYLSATRLSSRNTARMADIDGCLRVQRSLVVERGRRWEPREVEVLGESTLYVAYKFAKTKRRKRGGKERLE